MTALLSFPGEEELVLALAVFGIGGEDSTESMASITDTSAVELFVVDMTEEALRDSLLRRTTSLLYGELVSKRLSSLE
jgi:hypothetical protein